MSLKKELQGPISLLLAEDNTLDQEVMVRMLKLMGLCADLAGNGPEAIRALQRRRYDVIFMDLEMPGMGGIEATRIIRERWSNREIRIIAVTSRDQKGDRETCLQAGMDDYIRKPVRIGELRGALASLFTSSVKER